MFRVSTSSSNAVISNLSGINGSLCRRNAIFLSTATFVQSRIGVNLSFLYCCNDCKIKTDFPNRTSNLGFHDVERDVLFGDCPNLSSHKGSIYVQTSIQVLYSLRWYYTFRYLCVFSFQGFDCYMGFGAVRSFEFDH